MIITALPEMVPWHTVADRIGTGLTQSGSAWPLSSEQEDYG